MRVRHALVEQGEEVRVCKRNESVARILNSGTVTSANRCLRESGCAVVDVTVAILPEAYSLPELFHRDPVDRLLVGTARVHDLVIVTRDERILNYPHVKTLW